jgi:hypothetical protein
MSSHPAACNEKLFQCSHLQLGKLLHRHLHHRPRPIMCESDSCLQVLAWRQGPVLRCSLTERLLMMSEDAVGERKTSCRPPAIQLHQLSPALKAQTWINLQEICPLHNTQYHYAKCFRTFHWAENAGYVKQNERQLAQMQIWSIHVPQG